jgi:hypothetical protein
MTMSEGIISDDNIFDEQEDTEEPSCSCGENEACDQCMPDDGSMALMPRVMPTPDGRMALVVPIIASDILSDTETVEVKDPETGEPRQVEVAQLALPAEMLLGAVQAMQKIAQRQMAEQPIVGVEKDKRVWKPGDGDPGVDLDTDDM